MMSVADRADNGVGESVPFLYTGQAWSAIPRNVTGVRVHPSVKIIGDRAFSDCDRLAEVELREGLEGIGNHAFHGCKSLGSLEIPSTVKIIGDTAFTNCLKLARVELREGLERIAEFAFYNCKSLTNIKLPPTVKSIGEVAFTDCDQLEEVELNEGLEQIEKGAFRGCTSLRKLKIPSTVEVVGDWAFRSCKKLEEVELCEGMEHVGEDAFSGCESLRSVTFPSTAKVIGARAFFNCEELVEVRLNEGLERIGGCAFQFCASLGSIRIPPTTVIGAEAFQNCLMLMSVELCHDAEKIGKDAFSQCPSLRNIAIPSTSQGLHCFNSKCYDLMNVFGSREKIDKASRDRFVGLPIHKLCYYQSYYPTNVVLEQLTETIASMMDQDEASCNISHGILNKRDGLRMTPLHILTCSKTQNLDVYQFIVDKHPESLISVDEWGCVPIFYAICGNVSQEILLFLIQSHMCAFPTVVLDWDKMVENLCRAGASLEIIQRLLRIRQSSFPGHSIDWQKSAGELAVHSLVRYYRDDWNDFSLIWTTTMEAFTISQGYHELRQRLLQIQQTFFPDHTDVNWQLVCEHFVDPLRGWWQPDLFNLHQLMELFCFLIKCNIAGRLVGIGVRNWRTKISDMVVKISSSPGSGLVTYQLDAIQSKLVSFKHEYHQLEESAFLLELVLWKIKINESQMDSADDAAMRIECHISCRADIIIPNVLTYLIGNE